MIPLVNRTYFAHSIQHSFVYFIFYFFQFFEVTRTYVSQSNTKWDSATDRKKPYSHTALYFVVVFQVIQN